MTPLRIDNNPARNIVSDLQFSPRQYGSMLISFHAIIFES